MIKKKTGSGGDGLNDIDINDLNNLEDELNDFIWTNKKYKDS